MKIGIIGSEGIVGSALKAGFRHVGHEVIEHDVKLGTSIEIVKECNQVYVCVPTPMDPEDCSCCTVIVENVCRQLAEINYRGLVAIKSTVPPGTTEKIQATFPCLLVCFCPEFLRERRAKDDFIDHNRLIVGTHSHFVYEAICEAHKDLPLLTRKVTPKEAELCKYWHNLMGGLRVAICNEMYEICQKANINYDEVKKLVLATTGMPDLYMEVTENLRGYGGLCLEKDIPALIQYARELGLELPLLEMVPVANARYKKTILK